MIFSRGKEPENLEVRAGFRKEAFPRGGLTILDNPREAIIFRYCNAEDAGTI